MANDDIDIRFDRNDQVERIRHYAVPNETLHAVFDCKGGGTEFVGITDQRLIFYDHAFQRSHRSMISIPYQQVVGIAAADEGTMLKRSQITLLTSAGRFGFVIRDPDHARWAYEFIMIQVLSSAPLEGGR